MTGAGVDSLADVLQLGFIKSQSLSDLQVRFLIFVHKQVLCDVSVSLGEEESCREERVLQNDSSLPRLVDPL